MTPKAISSWGAPLSGQNYRRAGGSPARHRLIPKLAQAYLQLGQVLQALGETDVAIQQFEKALAIQRQNSCRSTRCSEISVLGKGNLGEARSIYEQALAIDPDFAIAASKSGPVYGPARHQSRHRPQLGERAKQRMPEMPSVTDTLGWVMYKKGIYMSALPLLQECVKRCSIPQPIATT